LTFHGSPPSRLFCLALVMPPPAELPPVPMLLFFDHRWSIYYSPPLASLVYLPMATLLADGVLCSLWRALPDLSCLTFLRGSAVFVFGSCVVQRSHPARIGFLFFPIIGVFLSRNAFASLLFCFYPEKVFTCFFGVRALPLFCCRSCTTGHGPLPRVPQRKRPSCDALERDPLAFRSRIVKSIGICACPPFPLIVVSIFPSSFFPRNLPRSPVSSGFSGPL